MRKTPTKARKKKKEKQMRDAWPPTLYDYARGAITDEAAADVDVEGGKWVRCRCCDVVRRSAVGFDTSAWEHHKATASHMARVKAASAHAVEESGRVRDTPEYADFAAAMMESIEKDTDYLVFYRTQVEQRAREEVQTKELIQKMALLVTEQQEDVESLREEVADLHRVIRELRSEMKAMATTNAAIRHASSHREREIERAPSRFVEIDESDVDMTPVKRPIRRAFRKNDEGARPNEIDIFGEDLQLMQLD